MRNRNLESLSSEEKEELESVKQQIKDYRKHGPHSFREHLQNFNDSVMSIIVTIIVLEIKPPEKAGSYQHFIADIAVFLITFFIIAEFCHRLHSMFVTFIHKPNKLVTILDFAFLADLSLLPVMTKWIMEKDTTFAVMNFGIVFLIAQILRMLLAYFGALATWKDSKVVEAVMFERSRWRILMVTMLNVGLIILAFFEPELAMIMYIAFPLISFFTPDRVVF